MSVLIKGMKMPKECADCYIRERDTCRLLKVNVSGWGRMGKCPLTELPDHGDLVDKNRMIDVLHNGSNVVSEVQRGLKDERNISYCQGVIVGYAASIVELNCAPVVIPAERSEYGVN